MLDSWLPFLIYGILALAIPASMIGMSFLFAQQPARRTRARTVPFESGVSTGPLPRQRFTRELLPHGDALHRLRHRDRLPLPARRAAPRARLVRVRELAFFVLILLVAYVYIWRKGASNW